MVAWTGVIFDLDGTLLDTLADLAEAGNQALAALGAPAHPVQSYRRFVGEGVKVLMRRALPPDMRQEETVGRGVDLFRTHYARTWNRSTAPYPGIEPLLVRLRSMPLSLAVLSNKPDSFTRRCVQALLPADVFDLVVGARDGVALKPDPAAGLRVVRELGLAPREVLYVGDTATDMLTATGAGMHAVGVLWGFRDAAELRRAGARTLLRRPQELLERFFDG